MDLYTFVDNILKSLQEALAAKGYQLDISNREYMEDHVTVTLSFTEDGNGKRSR